MATFYWVGGAGNWDATTTTNWASSSGGAGGAGVPTSTDNVVFDANSSGGGNFAVTITGTELAPALCEDFTASSLSHVMTLTMGATAQLDSYGSMTLPATNFAFSGTSGSIIFFKATTTGKTVTSNGVSFGSVLVNFNGVGGGWTLGSAFTSSVTVGVTSGTLSTNNYNITAAAIFSAYDTTRTINLGSSSVTLSGGSALNMSVTTNLTFNAGTSTITCSSASPTFNSGGLTFYNVTFSSNANGTMIINGNNTFNDLIFTGPAGSAAFRNLFFTDNQTISGTLTLGTTNTNIRKMQVGSVPVGTQRTITLNGTLSSLNDVTFRDIAAAGTVSTPWTGTRIGSGGNISNITADAPKNVYRVGTGNWSANQWSTSSGGAVNLDNFPLPQDAIIFDNNTTSGTHTINASWWFGSLNCSAVTSAITIANGAQGPQWHGDMTLDSDITITATGGGWVFVKPAASGTQIITPAGVTFAPPLNFSSPVGVQFAANITTDRAATLNIGTLDLNDYDLTCLTFVSNNTNTRSIDFGTSSEINVTGSDATVVNVDNATNFSYTGTSKINLTYSGSTGTRGIAGGNPATGGTEANAFNYYITAGSDIFNLSGTRGYKTVDFTGFSGTLFAVANPRTIYGNLIISSGMTLDASDNGIEFAATSGTQEITTAGKTFDFPVTVNAPGATVQLQDALTMGSTRTLTLTEGTLDLNGFDLTAAFFSSDNSNTRSVDFGGGSINLSGNDATIWNCATLTNFSYVGAPVVEFTYSGATGTRVIDNGGTAGATESNVVELVINDGSDIVSITETGSSGYKSLDYTGFTGTGNLGLTSYGSVTLGASMTVPATSTVLTFAATSGTQQLTTNSVALDQPITVDGAGGTLELQDALVTGATRAITLTNGTLDANNQNITMGEFALGSGTKTLTMGSGTWTIQGASWDADTNSAGLTINPDTSVISMTSASAHTFAGGSQTYYNLNVGGTGDLTIEGDNTFNEISDSVDGSTVYFTAGSTTITNAFTVDGASGNLILLRSTTPGSVWFLEQSTGAVSVAYVDIQDSDASGGATFQCINGVNSGNNTGWQFIDSGGSGGNFFIFF